MATCRPVGFEGPFDVPSAIRTEISDRIRCDVDTGLLQGVTLYFAYFAGRSALEAWHRHHGANPDHPNTDLVKPGINVILWRGGWNGRCVGWIQAPPTVITEHMLGMAWREYRPTDELVTDAC